MFRLVVLSFKECQVYFVPFLVFLMENPVGKHIPANSHSLGVSLTLFEIKYDLTPDFSE